MKGQDTADDGNVFPHVKIMLFGGCREMKKLAELILMAGFLPQMLQPPERIIHITENLSISRLVRKLETASKRRPKTAV